MGGTPKGRKTKSQKQPMHRKEPLANKGIAGMDATPAKNILTRRAKSVAHLHHPPNLANGARGSAQ
jgi:hypothetical protein